MVTHSSQFSYFSPPEPFRTAGSMRIMLQLPHTSRTPQRGLVHIYTMRVFCYQTWADESTRAQLRLCSEAVEAGPEEYCVRYYIREDRLSWARLIDPTLRHIRDLDYWL